MNTDIAVMVGRIGRNAISNQIAHHFGAQELACFLQPRHRLKDNTRILNFGRSDVPVWYHEALSRGCRFINHPHAVGLSVNKIKTFRALDGANVPTLAWTNNRAVAQMWLSAGDTVIVRHTATGSKGRGLEVVKPADATPRIPAAPLYTKYYDKTHEYRVFVVGKEAVFLVEKKMYSPERQKKENVLTDQVIRNHERGWFFSIYDLTCDRGTGREVLQKLAVDGAGALGLDFCALDIVAKHSDKGVLLDARICETNTAPSLTGKTTWAKVTTALELYMR